jgi:hypothetical protein
MRVSYSIYVLYMREDINLTQLLPLMFFWVINFVLFENRVRRRIFGPKRDEAQGSGEDYITRNLMPCTHNQILFR